MTKRHRHTLARRSALQVLYQSEILGMPVDKLIDEGLLPDEARLNAYARSLVLGVTSHIAGIDSAISSRSENWAIDRMPVVDRCVLRIAVFEMKYVDSVPVSVSINEAVELAKEFGGEDDSHRFVNGLLGRIAKDLDDAAANQQVSPTSGENEYSSETLCDKPL